MRAVYVEMPEELLRERRQMGIDLFDEMWEGELHMTGMPSWEHQTIEKRLAVFFVLHWELLGEGTCNTHVGVKPPETPDVDLAGQRVPRSYRGPDIVFLLKGHEDRIQGGWVVGPPDALIEVRSPGDETYEKFPYYFALGVTEVIVVHRDSKAVEVYSRGAGVFERVPVEPDGTVRSIVLDTSFRAENDPDGGRVVLRLRRGQFPEREGAV